MLRIVIDPPAQGDRPDAKAVPVPATTKHSALALPQSKSRSRSIIVKQKGGTVPLFVFTAAASTENIVAALTSRTPSSIGSTPEGFTPSTASTSSADEETRNLAYCKSLASLALVDAFSEALRSANKERVSNLAFAIIIEYINKDFKMESSKFNFQQTRGGMALFYGSAIVKKLDPLNGEDAAALNEEEEEIEIQKTVPSTS